jgi:hypothetical protein
MYICAVRGKVAEMLGPPDADATLQSGIERWLRVV